MIPLMLAEAGAEVAAAAVQVREHGLAHFVHGLKEWQDLAGGILGGLMGVVGAMIVAINVDRKERRAAASALLSTAFLTNRMIARVNVDEKGNAVGYQVRLMERVRQQRFDISPLFETYMLKIVRVSPEAFSYLAALGALHGQMDALLEEMEETVKGGPLLLLRVGQLYPLLRDKLTSMEQKATCAEYLLESLCEPLFERLMIAFRHRFKPTAADIKAQELTGRRKRDADKVKQ